ncbi:hypothetical protein MLD52_09850 [Puniceicoccaceae bacterium K14]|nr:hypothetical protein [Puniceicoccaceae bacterium K14]
MNIPNTNDSSTKAPALKVFLNTGTLRDLPKGSALFDKTLSKRYETIHQAGFHGLQDGHIDSARDAGLELTGSCRINHPLEVLPLIEQHQSKGFLASTLHVGWGIESDAEIDALLSAIISVSTKLNYPLFVETHRATITQDNWRTVQAVLRFPETRFNGDFSHWYTGHEMVYGDWQTKIQFMQPVLERVRFIHGRIATPGSIQAPLTANSNAKYIVHFREIWRRCFEGFLKSAKKGDFIIFAPELLPPVIHYAQTFQNNSGEATELSDRWQDALLLKQIAEEEFENARMNTSVGYKLTPTSTPTDRT